ARIASKLVQVSPTPSNFAARALTELAQGRDEQAIASFQEALRLEQPDDPYGSAWTRTLLGRLYARRGQLELARGLFEEALRI
ncbi:tetratricopeptide repeat protein, partial [Escherichia coli]|nr:tetratricopeptide repeat protein [Escherichia coli]